MSFWPRTLRLKAVGVVVLIALLAIGNVVTLQLLLRGADNVATTLSVASNMRMLSQRIALETLAEQLAPGGDWPAVQRRYEDFEIAYHALRNGGTAYGLQVQPVAPFLIPALENIYTRWQEYRQAIDTAHAALQNETSVTRAEVVQVMAASDLLWAETEFLLNRLVEHSETVQQRASTASLVLFALDALLLVLGYMLIERRVLHPIRALAEQCREMTRGNYSTHNHICASDELGELAQALNHSASHIEQLLHDVAQERGAVAQIQAMFNGLANNSVTGIYMLDANMCFIYANEQLAQMTGYPREQLSDHFPLKRLIADDDWDAIRARGADRLCGHIQTARYELSMNRADGSKIDVEGFSSGMHYQGAPAIIGMLIDISARKRSEASMRRAALVYAHTSEAMVVADAQGVVQDINPAFTAITGYEAHEVLGRRLNILSSGRHDLGFYQEMWGALQQHGRWSGDIINRRKNGEEFIERLTITTSYNEDGSVNSHIGLFTDVTKLRQREATIWRQAHYDHLTQLPNRQMFQETLLRSIDESRRAQKIFALVFLDLDFFKEVNDTFGHDEGDELLRQVASRLQSCVRSTDLVARLGGDEFILILHDIRHPEDVAPVCEKVLHAVAQPYVLGSNTAQISVSAGVTFYPKDGTTGVDLLRHADLAMYAAKDKGRNQYCVFDPSMEEEAQSRRLLLRDLQKGLEKKEFRLHYQPIVEMRTGRIAKAEALLRWDQPVRGRVDPGDFIPLAEESGLIVPLGDWIIEEATRQVAAWRKEFVPDFVLSVNVSPVQLHSTEPNHERWLSALRTSGVVGESLVLEITERVLLEADAASDAKIQQLQETGMQLALDDFGTGYSSLSYLKRFDIDYIKIDRSFVCNLHRGSEDVALCQAIIVMAHQLGIQVVAEGVETQEQHQILLEAGCDYGQGYWYCRPVPAQAFTERLAEQQLAPMSEHQKSRFQSGI